MPMVFRYLGFRSSFVQTKGVRVDTETYVLEDVRSVRGHD